MHHLWRETERKQEGKRRSSHRTKRANSKPAREESPVRHLQRTAGNRAVQQMLKTNIDAFTASSASRAAIGSAHEIDQVPAHTRQGAQESQAAVHSAAKAGVSGSGRELPHLKRISESFGRYDVDGVRAHTNRQAADATQSMGARAYTVGERMAFDGWPSLHTAAHEAAHVVQQRHGVPARFGMPQKNEAFERHADSVADRVTRGRSAEALLDEPPVGPSPGALQAEAVQLQQTPTYSHKNRDPFTTVADPSDQLPPAFLRWGASEADIDSAFREARTRQVTSRTQKAASDAEVGQRVDNVRSSVRDIYETRIQNNVLEVGNTYAQAFTNVTTVINRESDARQARWELFVSVITAGVGGSLTRVTGRALRRVIGVTDPGSTTGAGFAAGVVELLKGQMTSLDMGLPAIAVDQATHPREFKTKLEKSINNEQHGVVTMLNSMEGSLTRQLRDDVARPMAESFLTTVLFQAAAAQAEWEVLAARASTRQFEIELWERWVRQEAATNRRRRADNRPLYITTEYPAINNYLRDTLGIDGSTLNEWTGNTPAVRATRRGQYDGIR